jgi:tetratricopeptide (TPR) repeat protein
MLRTCFHRGLLASAALASIVLAPLPAAGQHQHAAAPHQHPAGGHEQLGTVDFVTSCTAAAKPDFNRAVALLHSFEFGDAIKGFTAALGKDPSCAMAEWGIAMSRWGNPFGAAQRAAKPLEEGAAAVARGKALAPKTPREQAYLGAVGELFANVATVDQRTRFVAYRDAMAALAAANPTDPEAQIFYALSVAGSHVPSDKSYAQLLKAGEILEGLIGKYPEHPGLSHYIIHSYDVPALADRGLAAARRYAKIAPSAPHALHMPSHTFTRVGSWQESIDTNIASAESARKLNSTAEELHAMDYQAYAALQTGQDGVVKALIVALPPIKARFDPDAIGGAAPGSAGLYAIAAIPARYALERGDWKAAAALTPESSKFVFPEAQTWFAKALGAARSADAAGTKAAIAELMRIREELTAKKEVYWAEQAEIQRRTATAWLALVEGRAADALTEMTAAADAEDRTEKAAVTPGPLAPARELLGEMLLTMEKPAEALHAFEATLKKEPNRFRALSGAIKAATLAGQTSRAREHAQTLLKVCAKADAPPRPELAAAKKLLSSASR